MPFLIVPYIFYRDETKFSEVFGNLVHFSSLIEGLLLEEHAVVSPLEVRSHHYLVACAANLLIFGSCMGSWFVQALQPKVLWGMKNGRRAESLINTGNATSP